MLSFWRLTLFFVKVKYFACTHETDLNTFSMFLECFPLGFQHFSSWLEWNIAACTQETDSNTLSLAWLENYLVFGAWSVGLLIIHFGPCQFLLLELFMSLLGELFLIFLCEIFLCNYSIETMKYLCFIRGYLAGITEWMKIEFFPGPDWYKLGAWWPDTELWFMECSFLGF